MEKSLFLYKSDFHWQSNAFLWLDFQTHGFSYHCKEIKIGVMFSSLRKAKKKLLREVYLLARCLMLNWSLRHDIILYATKTWNLWVFLLYSFSKVFAEKYIKYFPQEMKNCLSLQKLQVILHYIITWAFISSLADKTNAPRKNKQYFHFSSPLKDTEIFPKLLFWTLNSSCVPQLISYYNLYIWWQ